MSKEYEALDARLKTLENEKEKVYHFWSELPEWGIETVKKLYNRGIFRGESESDLNLPETMLRVMVTNDRAGLYDRT